jgi:hypothetical protein
MDEYKLNMGMIVGLNGRKLGKRRRSLWLMALPDVIRDLRVA